MGLQATYSQFELACRSFRVESMDDGVGVVAWVEVLFLNLVHPLLPKFNFFGLVMYEEEDALFSVVGFLIG